MGTVKKTKINAERPQPVARGHGGLSGGRRTNRPVCGVTPAAGWLPVNEQIISFKRRRPRPSAPPPFPQTRL